MRSRRRPAGRTVAVGTVAALALATGLASCATRDVGAAASASLTAAAPATEGSPAVPSGTLSPTSASTTNQGATTMHLTINGHDLEVELADNSSADALTGLLRDGDLTIEMSDYNRFEKVGTLPQALPTNDERITTAPGDVILYQGNRITIYYDANTWSLTRLGRVTGVSAEELRQILGDGDVTVTLSLG